MSTGLAGRLSYLAHISDDAAMWACEVVAGVVALLRAEPYLLNASPRAALILVLKRRGDLMPLETQALLDEMGWAR